MNTVEIGPTLRAELAAQRVILGQEQLDKIIAVLRAHDHTKRIVISVDRLSFTVELAHRVVAADCPATQMGFPAGTNLYTAIDTLIASSGDLPKQLRWQAPVFAHTDPDVIQMGALFDYDEDALVRLFIAAKGRE